VVVVVEDACIVRERGSFQKLTSDGAMCSCFRVVIGYGRLPVNTRSHDHDFDKDDGVVEKL